MNHKRALRAAVTIAVTGALAAGMTMTLTSTASAGTTLRAVGGREGPLLRCGRRDGQALDQRVHDDPEP